MKKVWLYEILFFQMVIAMVKDKKRCTIKDTMSIKISFMHYRNYITRAKLKLPVVFEEFDLGYIFWLLFFFSLSLPIGKRSTLTKIWRDCSPPVPPPPPGFYRPAKTKTNSNFAKKTCWKEQPFIFTVYLIILMNHLFPTSVLFNMWQWNL